MISDNELKWNLINSLSTVTSIQCSKCKKTDNYGGDSDECLDAIFDDGWYATKNNTVYCKSCDSKRKNKNLKQ